MVNYNGYQIKVYNEKCEIYKNNEFIASEDDVEKAKKLIDELTEE